MCCSFFVGMCGGWPRFRVVVVGVGVVGGWVGGSLGGWVGGRGGEGGRPVDV